MMTVRAARHLYPDVNGFTIDRPCGFENCVVFVHFRTRVSMTLGKETINVEPGNCIFFSRAFYQKWTACEPLIHDWMHLDGDVENVLCEFGIEFNRLYKLNQPELATQLVNAIETEHFAQKPLHDKMCDLKLRELFICVSRNLPAQNTNSPARKEELEKLRQRVFSQLSHNWTIPEMASLISMSPSRFYAVYKNEFGVSPINDLIEARIHLAKSYLSSGEYSVSAAAEKLGYSSTYHFIRQFTKCVGVSPGKFAKNSLI